MSTIHGYYHPQHTLDRQIVENMLVASEYWKPDAHSYRASATGNCHLAKASLFNTPNTHRDNVYLDGATGAIITANARLDNRLSLASKLGLQTSESAHLSNSQLILKAYQKWGSTCPSHLLGDFVFIIWDEARQQLFCARDHFGVKLLLYSRTERGVMISNEPNAFFTSHWLKKKLKEHWIVDQFWGVVSPPVETAYQGLETLPAAHSMIINRSGVTLSRYWSLSDSDQWQRHSDDALLTEFKARFQQAVMVRMDSAYPLAAELSEGLDSNGIVGFAAQLQPDRPLYTLSYECIPLTEDNRPVWGRTYQDIFAMLDMHSNLRPVWSSEPDDDTSIHTYIRHTGGVFATYGGNLHRCRLAHRQNARVLLSGWGGDHCVSAYGDFYDSELFSHRNWRALQNLLRAKHRRGRGAHPLKAWLILLLKHGAPWVFHQYSRHCGGLERALWQRSKHALLKPEYINRYRCIERLRAYTDNYQRFSVKGQHRRELFDIGVEQRLIDSELSARMFRLEFRFPMLDVPLIEMAYNLPARLKIHSGIERYHFRHILEGVTTPRIQWRLKADIDRPGIDFKQRASERLRRDLPALTGTSLFDKYCEPSRLRMLNQTASTPLLMFNKKLPSFSYYAAEAATY